MTSNAKWMLALSAVFMGLAISFVALPMNEGLPYWAQIAAALVNAFASGAAALVAMAYRLVL